MFINILTFIGLLTIVITHKVFDLNDYYDTIKYYPD